MRLLVTCYRDPDLDGVASAFAYAEYLKKRGQDAVAAIFGTPHREALYVMNRFKVPPLPSSLAVKHDAIILVDASDLRGLGELDHEKVVELIDHRKFHEAHTFPNAKAQIEQVGSCATIIGEKFYMTGIPITRESAALLYSAIISNTINFQAKVTTDRDRDMADWLRPKFPCPPDYAQEMFREKSRITSSLKDIFMQDFASFQFKYNIGIIQLEITDVDTFITTNLQTIKRTLEYIKEEKALDMICLTCIDLVTACNRFVAFDQSQHILQKALGVTFSGGIASRESILMRKEIVPLVKAVVDSGIY